MSPVTQVAWERYHKILPFLSQGVPLAKLAHEEDVPVRTMWRWVQTFQRFGLAGLARKPRMDLFDDAIEDALDARSAEDRTLTDYREHTELIIVDEADRLKLQSLEQLRDTFDRSGVGLVLLGMPGMEKRLSRYPQLYSRVGFVHEFKPLSQEEMIFILEHKWSELGLNLKADDFMNVEAIPAVARITQGNFRLLQRLLAHIERLLAINGFKLVSKELVEVARESLVIGVA